MSRLCAINFMGQLYSDVWFLWVSWGMHSTGCHSSFYIPYRKYSVFFLFMICSICSHFYITLSCVYCPKPDKFFTCQNLFINEPDSDSDEHLNQVSWQSNNRLRSEARGVKPEEWSQRSDQKELVKIKFSSRNSRIKSRELSQIQSAGTGSHKVVVSLLNRSASSPQPQTRSVDDGELVSWCYVWGSSGTCLHE